MKLKFAIQTIVICLSALSCREQVEPQSIAGYIIDTPNSNLIILSVPDSIPSERRYIINDDTQFSGGGIVEGNIAEVIYMPAEDGEQPIAQSVVADVTYPRIIGHWVTDKDDDLQIELLLQPHGRIKQNKPEGTLLFESWQLTGEENTITLHGTLSLPPQREPKDKSKDKSKDRLKEDDEQEFIPQRQEKRFSVVARLAYDEEGNTEQHKVLIITTDKGRTSKLYPAWE